LLFGIPSAKAFSGADREQQEALPLMRMAQETGAADEEQAMGMRFDEDETGTSRTPLRAFGAKSASPFERLRNLLRGKLAIHITEDHVQSLLSVRRGREDLFGRHLFSDPAWDIILELYAAKLANRRMSSSEVAQAIGAPKSVIARWLTALADAGVVMSDGDQDEMEELAFRLTDEGAAKLAQLVDQWASAFLSI
jgi:DNA-binding MarR family transcriptional regulator